MINFSVNNKQQFFDIWASRYDWIFTSVFYQAVHKRLLEYVNLAENPNILDLGCGTGKLLDRLAINFPKLHGTGLDLSAEMLHQARQNNGHHPRLIYIQGNAEAMPFAKGQFDAVFNTLSFLHYPNPEKVFAEVSRVLHPGGYFYLVDPTVRTEAGIQEAPFSPGGIRLYSRERRENFGRQAGLNCLGHHYLLGLVTLTIFSKPLI